jgi:hypothetical protein
MGGAVHPQSQEEPRNFAARRLAVAVKRRKPANDLPDNGYGPIPSLIPLKPLAVSGICISKATLLDALRIYVPALMGIEVFEDGERFLLTLAPAGDEDSAGSVP